MTTPLFPEPAGPAPGTPLAERLRPRTLEDFVGQAHLIAPGRPLRETLEGGALHSMIFWGPPGAGKTSGIKEIREVIAAAEQRRVTTGRRTVLFVDEIHRFNKAQQDAFLPHVESGTIALVGATTENPSFEVNSALLSRSRVYVLKPLEVDDVVSILRRALADRERGRGTRRFARWPSTPTATPAWRSTPSSRPSPRST
jgi:putative ATPase